MDYNQNQPVPPQPQQPPVYQPPKESATQKVQRTVGIVSSIVAVFSAIIALFTRFSKK